MDDDLNKINSQRLVKIQKDLEERIRVLVIRGALSANFVNPYKEYENEFDISASGLPRGNRRRNAPFEFDGEDDEENGNYLICFYA